MTTSKKPVAGDEIDSGCLKCKDITNHRIIAMDGDKVAKVICNVCKSRHNYRPPKPEKAAPARKTAKKTPARKTTRLSPEAKAEAHYQEVIAGRNPSDAVAYAMDGTFREDDLLDHHVFGLGLVTRTIQPNKIEVVFREGTKILICEASSP